MVEKMGPLRGDGNALGEPLYPILFPVEKMDPLRGRIKLLVQYRTKTLAIRVQIDCMLHLL